MKAIEKIIESWLYHNGSSQKFPVTLIIKKDGPNKKIHEALGVLEIQPQKFTSSHVINLNPPFKVTIVDVDGEGQFCFTVDKVRMPIATVPI